MTINELRKELYAHVRIQIKNLKKDHFKNDHHIEKLFCKMEEISNTLTTITTELHSFYKIKLESLENQLNSHITHHQNFSSKTRWWFLGLIPLLIFNVIFQIILRIYF